MDPLTPLCTQLTYEGLVDETLHIKNGVVQLGAEGMALRPACFSQGLLICCRLGWLKVDCLGAEQGKLSTELKE